MKSLWLEKTVIIASRGDFRSEGKKVNSCEGFKEETVVSRILVLTQSIY